MEQTGGAWVGFLHNLQSVSGKQVVSVWPVMTLAFSSGTKPTSHEQSWVQKDRVGSLMHDVTGSALASQLPRVASPVARSPAHQASSASCPTHPTPNPLLSHLLVDSQEHGRRHSLQPPSS
jgi:hypothetical protein